MRWTPRPDQQQVLDFLETRERACLWSPCGSGKTAITLGWLNERMYNRFTVARTLIIAPPMVCQGWVDQMQRWDQFRHMAGDVRLLGPDDLGLTPEIGPDGRRGALTFRDKRATKAKLLSYRERITIVPWSFWTYVVKACGMAFPWDCVVPDEASFLKQMMSERSKAARYAVHKTGRVSHMLQLTGTPAANHPDSLFPQVDLVAPGLLGPNLTNFRETFCKPATRNWQTGQVYSWAVRPEMQEELDRRVATVAVSVPSTLDVPLVMVEQPVDMPQAAADVYERMAHDWVAEGVTAGSEAVLAFKLRQCAAGFMYRDGAAPVNLHAAKLDRLEAMLEQIEGPVIIVYEFEEQLAQLKARFKGIEDVRDATARAEFMAGRRRLLALHPGSAAHGLDGCQHVCNQAVWLSPTWDLELFNQTNGRVHRNGTNAATVYVHLLLSRNTIDERIVRDVLPGKATLHDAILAGARVTRERTT